MNINWGNLPVLPSPRRAARDQYDREKLARAKLKRSMKKPSKAHGTGKKNYQIRCRKKKRADRLKKLNDEQNKQHLDQVCAYWRGDRDNYPSGES